LVDFWETIRRGETGKRISEREFEMQRVSLKIIELQREHSIHYDREIIVPSDNSLADSVWQAAIELLVHSGVYYTQTGRVIEFSEEEIKDEIKHAPKESALGEGEDRVIVRSRDVEDPEPPLVFGGPFGAPVSEEVFVKLNQAYAQEPLIDVLYMPGHVENIEGLEIRSESPTEVQAARCFGEWTREALRRAGRPGMAVASIGAGITSLNEVAASDPQTGLRRYDPRIVNFLPELKVDAVNVSKAAHYLSYGCPIATAFLPFCGGFGGDPSGTAIIATAYHIATRLIFKGLMGFMGPQHIRFGQQSNPHSLFMSSLTGQATSRNSKLLRSTTATVSGRPPSAQNLYEGAAISIAATVSGTSNINGGPRPARTIFYNHVSPLATRLYAEVGHAVAGIKRAKANEILKELTLKYVNNIAFDKAPRGKPFEEIYDLSVLKPTQEAMDQYNEARRELEGLGIDFD
jgi:methylamine--corrinoid protein Co-methyltransferase